MVIELFIKHIGASLHNWLNYISTVQRGYVLAESSIIYPVSEYVASQTGNTKVFLEEEHPNLTGKFIDLRLFKRFLGENVEFGFEFKYARIDYTEKSGEKQRIFDDLLRLKIFKESKKNRKAYFIICGSQLDFLKSFQSIGWSINHDPTTGLPIPYIIKVDDVDNLNIVKPNGFYTNWFQFKFEDKTNLIKNFNVSDTAIVPTTIYDGFFDDYEKALKGTLTKAKIAAWSISTKLVFMSDINNMKELTNPMRVAIWEVE